MLIYHMKQRQYTLYQISGLQVGQVVSMFEDQNIPDNVKSRKILDILRKYKNSNVWYRRIAKETKIPVATVKRYCERYLADYVEIRSERVPPFSTRVSIVRLIKEPVVV